MIKFIMNRIKNNEARKRIIKYGRDKFMPDWDIRIYLSLLPDNPTEADVQRVMRMMDEKKIDFYS